MADKQENITCPKCSHIQRMDIYESINVQTEPALKDKIVKNELFSFTCTQCGYTAQVYYPCLYHDMAKKLMIYFMPQTKGNTAEKAKFLEIVKQNAMKLFNTVQGYQLRIVETNNDFIEKILLADAGLDDRIIEIMKQMILQQNTADKGTSDFNQLYFDHTQQKLQFSAYKDGKPITGIEVPDGVYEQVQQQAAPLTDKMLSAEFMTINNDWAAKIVGK